MADGYISQITLPDNSTYLLKDSNALPLSGGSLSGGLEIKGQIKGDNSGTTGHGLYSGGGYHRDYNNIILHGDASTGTSGIAFVSDKIASDGTITNVNAPSDRAFIQYHANGITTTTTEGTAPTLATTGEAGRLVIGIGNDSGDKILLQAPGNTDILHQKGATGYPIPHTINTNGSVGGATTPVYVEAGEIKAGTALGTASQKAESYFVKAITSTDNAVARFNGTSGQIQNSGVTIDDNDNLNVSGSTITLNKSIIRNNTTVPGQGDLVLALAYKTGYPVYDDTTFKKGLNNIEIYNNSSNGTVVLTRDAYADFNIPSPGTDSGFVIQIKTSGTAAPGCGGFVQKITARANAIFVQIFRALVPEGRSLLTTSNSMGTNYKDEWITSNAGTGKWEWYARRVICGQEGTMSSGGYVYINGEAGTENNPVIWYLGACTLYDVTKADYDGLWTRYAEQAVQAKISSTQYGISYYSDATGTFASTNAGTSGQYLKSNGTSAPTWATFSASTVGLGNVENTKLSTWAGSSNITTLGTITTGTWHGTKIANDYIANPKITIAGNDVNLGGSLTANTLVSSLGLSKAMRFIGIATNAITDGGTEDPGITDYSTKTVGDVIIDSSNSREYVWSTTNKWELLGGDSSYKVVQEAVASPTASTTTSTTFIDTISQNENGVITATKKTLPSASSSIAGIVKLGASGGAATYDHNHNSTYLKLDGSNNMTADVNIIAGDTDKFVNFWYNTNKTAGASWRIGMLGSGSNDTNYFVIESGTSTTSATTWNRTVQIGQNTYDITIKGNLIPSVTNTKTLGTSSYKWANVYATTFTGNLTGNADSATKLETAREIYVDLATTRNTNSKVTFDGTADISIHVNGTLPVIRGGTGLTTSTTLNAVVIGNSTTATDAFQTVATASGAFYATDNNAKPTFGTLPIAQGGTNATSFTNGCVIVPSTTNSKQSLGSTGLKVDGATNGNITLSPYTAGKTMTISSTTGAMTISTTTAAMSLSTTNGNISIGSTGSGTLNLTTSSGNMSLSSGGTISISSANAKAMTISSGHNLALSSGNSQDITITSAKDIIYTAANNSSHIFKMNTTEYGRFNASGMFQLNETGEQSSHKLYVNGNSAFNGKIAFGEESNDSIAEKAYMIYNNTDESIDFIFA